MSQTGDATRRRLRFSRKKKKKSPTGDMSLVEHLQELRRRVIISLLALLAGTIVGFIWYQHAPFGTMPLGEILRGPYCELPPESRADFTRDGECRLLATRPFEMFMLRLKVGALAGLVLSSPVWLYQIWAFIVPGLHKKERRSTFTFVTLAVTLFVLGALIAYFIVGFALEFLMTMGTEFAVSALTGQDYYNFLLGLLVIFGVSFEVPLIIIMLNIVGVLEYQTLKEKRRMIILILFVFAAFMTPGQDPFSMVVLAACLVLLVEMAIQFTRINDKKRQRERPEWMDLDDESASPLNTAPGGTDAPAPISRPAPVDAPRPTHTSGFDDVL
ncbi:sec-independent protein translocase protein TatC [Corynebacterium pollutisoli]|uniref:Sec-independent protein translocase protein TatC n=1 Tax=Corynebacterium pollutisoli TaxID=1610489 RepID=A0A1X7JQ68_9CORY|nr:sec-independent protein translocase protein TatC [Corynebacterium pollutisoli]